MNKQDVIISLLKEIDKNIDNVDSGGNVSKVKVLTFRVSNDGINEDGRWEGESLIDNSNCISYDQTFSNCTKLKRLEFKLKTDIATNLSNIFNYCTNLEYVDTSEWKLDNVVTMYHAFYACSNLVILGGSWGISNKLSNVTGAFEGCYSLTSINAMSWNFSGVSSTYMLFAGCKSLQSLIGGLTEDKIDVNTIVALNGLKVHLSLNETILDHASLRAIINGLADLTGQTAQTLALGETLITKLTEEDIAIATAKNWTIA